MDDTAQACGREGPSLGEEVGVSQTSRRLLAYIAVHVFSDAGGAEDRPADERTVYWILRNAFEGGFISDDERQFVLELIDKTNVAVLTGEVKPNFIIYIAKLAGLPGAEECPVCGRPWAWHERCPGCGLRICPPGEGAVCKWCTCPECGEPGVITYEVYSKDEEGEELYYAPKLVCPRCGRSISCDNCPEEKWKVCEKLHEALELCERVGVFVPGDVEPRALISGVELALNKWGVELGETDRLSEILGNELSRLMLCRELEKAVEAARW